MKTYRLRTEQAFSRLISEAMAEGAVQANRSYGFENSKRKYTLYLYNVANRGFMTAHHIVKRIELNDFTLQLTNSLFPDYDKADEAQLRAFSRMLKIRSLTA